MQQYIQEVLESYVHCIVDARTSPTVLALVLLANQVLHAPGAAADIQAEVMAVHDARGG